MLQIQLTQPSPEPSAATTPTLADLSRNASVISTSSSSSSSSSLVMPVRPRPIRTFSSPRSRSPHAPATPRASRPPQYLSKELGLPDPVDDPRLSPSRAAQPRAQSRTRSRTNSASRFGADDFNFGDILGEGSYSTVMQATHRVTKQEYAIKVLDKGHLARNNKLQTALIEKNTLVRLGAGHPGIVKLHWTFQDEYSLFFVLDLARNGELQSRISKMGSLSVECSCYYAAQIVDALDYMHGKGVIHRDLKPENLLLDDNFRLKITDFGTGKILDSDVQTAKTFVGTAQYVAPELLENNETSRSSDLWALGCILYQMISGRFAFHGLSEYLTWQKVKALDYTCPDGFDEQAKDLVGKLLVKPPTERLGAGEPGSSNDIKALRAHPFFASIEWSTLWTNAAPTLESGLVKKEPKPANNHWDDVEYNWDHVVAFPRSDDEIPWAGEEDQEEPDQRTEHGDDSNSSAALEEETEESSSNTSGGSEEKGETDTPLPLGPPPVAPVILSASKPIAVPTPPVQQDVFATGSTTSSSEGSPIEKLSAALEAALNRGRNRIQTPIQGNGHVDPNWSSILLLGEGILFQSVVATSSLRRRPSKLLSMATKKKTKARMLILTNTRLICVKVEKGGKVLAVRGEWVIPTGKEKSNREEPKPGGGRGKGRGKEIQAVISVDPKGEKDFVVLTATKSFSFVTEDSALRSKWISTIRGALDLTTTSKAAA